MRRTLFLVFALLTAAAAPVHAQWQIQNSGSTADLRGVHSVGAGVAWASGTDGTVLRTQDGGHLWQHCAVPPGAEKLDFRGIQAFDAKTAIVMSSGKGDLSRLYKTTDGCQTWKLIFSNPDKEGFFDSISSNDDAVAYILGDSVGEKTRIWEWSEDEDPQLYYGTQGKVEKDEGSFAASNSVLVLNSAPQMDKTWRYDLHFASGTPDHKYISSIRTEHTDTCEPCVQQTSRVEVAFGKGASAGVFSLAFKSNLLGMAVGGTYDKPALANENAAFTTDGGQTWTASITPPHGYRSAVAYDASTKTWITVGPNGTDISTDDGRNWRALKPGPTDPADADQHWNALSLPFVVGPHGRIGVLNPAALKGTSK